MKFIPSDLEGACLIQLDPLRDSRGFFARLWCQQEFARQGIAMNIAQASVSHNSAAGTLRGLHFQWPPSSEAKLVRCQRGRIHDVIVDLRPQSPTFTRHAAFELDSSSHDTLYVPPGFAHGFQTLEADSDIVYMMSDHYQPELADGVRFDDPEFGICWPLPVNCISAMDRDCPDFDRQSYAMKYLQGHEALSAARLPGWDEPG
jgi:dTDP-4-dehydrorhamnose 3,5-epimerase